MKVERIIRLDLDGTIEIEKNKITLHDHNGDSVSVEIKPDEIRELAMLLLQSIGE